jgi:diguanylate cyclase (GGDEF)-like protein/putative nucleotidyltransferase with HDIG domain
MKFMQDEINNKVKDAEIIVIDDSAVGLQMLARILGDKGFQVRQANSGEAAFALIKTKIPDLILLDMHMPELDGFEVCRRLKAEPDTQDIPVIFLATSEEEKHKVLVFEAGGVDFITKPYQPEEVFARVNSQLEVYLLRRELELCSKNLQDEAGRQKLILQEEREKFKTELLAQNELLKDFDQLTGLYSLRRFESEIKRFDEDKYFPLTLIMIDVNGLKLLNSAYGQKHGDLLLKKVAEVLKKECRADDIVARIGGDKFIVLLPCCDAKHADIIISRINKAIAKESFEHIVFSLSIGFAVKNDAYDDIDDVMKMAEDEMYRQKLSESLSIMSKIIYAIMNTLFEKNIKEKLHSKRVSSISEAIANKMKFSEYEVKQIKLAGLVHDIGKIGIDESVLKTQGKLTGDGWNEMQRHAEIGYRILSSSNEFSEIAKFVLEHHERWDGKGYPRGLKGKEISSKARIIAVADAYDDMISERSYKDRLTKEEAIIEIRKHAGTQFDPEVAEVFIDKVLGKL